jgi:hypothetical protein
MPHDNPDLPGLLATAREFLDDLIPRLEGQDRYHALCTVYLLEIASRELGAEWVRRDTPDDQRLRTLAGAAPGTQSGHVLTELCRDIRAGRYDARMDELLETLTAHVVAKVKIAKPAVLAEEHRDADSGTAGDTHG